MARDLTDRAFWLAKEEEVRRAETTDIYFLNTVEVLRKRGLNPEVVMEVYARALPYPENWGVVTGIYEVAKLLEGLPVNVRAMEEGEIFLASPSSVVYEPVLQIEGRYADFATFENPILGLLCMSTGISTKAARVKLSAGDKPVSSFGTRRVHPALAPLVERAAYIGGFDSVSNVLGARFMNKKPVGTMPHALIQCFGDQREAWRAFDEVLPKELPRIALIDTFSDEKAEAIMALEALGERLYGVRIDTPGSRRGDIRRIVEEVRWELNIRGGSHVKILVSGGMDEESVRELRDLVDGFGVGTAVSGAPVVDFSAKIVEVISEGKSIFRAKRGDIGGKKEAFRKEGSLQDVVTLAGREVPPGHRPLLKELISEGRIVREFRGLEELRGDVLRKLKMLGSTVPTLCWT